MVQIFEVFLNRLNMETAATFVITLFGSILLSGIKTVLTEILVKYLRKIFKLETNTACKCKCKNKRKKKRK